MTLLVVALPAFPVWVSFHSGTIGTLMAAITGTREALGGNASLVWGVVVLLTVLVLAATGGYARQERFQTVVVATMLLSVIIALVLLRPDWWGFVSGFFRWPAWQYPEWAAALPEFKDRPVWVEAATYAGVVGGSGYDYLAYVAWLRDKHGVGSARQVGPLELNRLVLADATVSFVCVLLFSAVFVACGHILLGPRHQIPAGADLLTLQAQFVGFAGAWLKPLYFLGAFLALGGTLYGTIEVAPAILRELVHSVKRPDQVSLDPDRLRRWAVRWCGVGALVILILTLAWRLTTGAKEPFNLVALLTPANLFTGVLACGWISLLNVWADRRVATGVGRMSWPLRLANLVGGVAFSFVGLKAAWDQAGAMAFVVLVGCVAAGWGLAAWRERSR